MSRGFETHVFVPGIDGTLSAISCELFNFQSFKVSQTARSVNFPVAQFACNDIIDTSRYVPDTHSTIPVLFDRFPIPVVDIKSTFTYMVAKCERFGYFQGRFDACAKYKTLSLENGVTVEVGNQVGSGGYATVYSTNSTDLIVKVSQERNLCSEIAALTLLDGSSIAPRIMRFDKGLSPYCQIRMIVMHKVGEIDWEQSYSPFFGQAPPIITDTYHRIATLIRIIKQLHEKGFVHRDIHDENVRLSQIDPRAVWLIDFGKVRILTETDRLKDLQAVAKLVPVGISCIDKFKAIVNDPNYMFNASHEYDRWIDHFSTLSHHDTEC